MSWSKRLTFASAVRWSVGIGSALVEFHPAPQRRLDPYGRVDPLQVGVLDVLLDLAAELDEGLLLGGALARRLGLGADAGDDLAGLLQDCVAVEVVQVPARGAGLLGEFPGLPIEGWKRVTEKDAPYTFGRALTTAEGGAGLTI